MNTAVLRRRGLLAAVATVILLPGAGQLTAVASPPAGSAAHSFLTVMTRNLDEGTDFHYFVAAAQGAMTFADAVGATYAEVLASDVCGRAARIADEIAAAEPDLVSLQEAAVWTGPVPVDCPGAGSATTIDAGAALMHRLAADGARYAVVKQLDEVGSSSIAGLLPPGLSFLDRDLMLARVEPPARLTLAHAAAQHYQTILSLPLAPGLAIPIVRGWISVDATVNGRTARVIATHLESFFEPVQTAQAMELAAGPAATALPVIVAGDLNTGPGSAQLATYSWLTGPAGFADSWSATRPGDPGFTDSYYTEDPLAPTAGPTERIDLILVRGMPVAAAPQDYLVGTEVPHPSDHAGVVAKLRIPS